MSAVAEFGAYQRAITQAARVGIGREEAIHAVAEARKEGATGYHVAGQVQHAAMRAARTPDDDPPRAA